MKKICILPVVCMLFCCYGCGVSVPNTFIQTREPTWTTMEIRNDLDYDRAWNTVLELIIKKFDIDKVMKSEGYILTDWSYSWSGDYLKYYRVRTTVKFSPDRTKLQLKPEAQFLSDDKEGVWTVGSDTQLLATLKTDLMGTVGRTTR